MKHILMIASRPFLDDGLTKIEFDVLEFSRSKIYFDVAIGFKVNDRFQKRLSDLGIRYYYLGNKKSVLKYMIKIYRLVKTNKYDDVYIHGNSAMMFLEAIPSKLAGTKVITHCHNTRSNYPVIHYIIKPIFNLFVDIKIGCSSLASKWAYNGKKTVTIGNGIDTKRFSFNEDDRKETREALGWNNYKIVGHIGRFIDQKNHQKLLSIFKCMLKKDKDFRLLLIGDGELRETIEKLIIDNGLSDYVTVIRHTDIPNKYLSAMDIMIMPSLFEGLCLVALEAQANGLPILLSDKQDIETVASKVAKMISLSLSDEIWANEAISMITEGRKDTIQELKNKQMEYSNMLNRIEKLLIGD